MATALLDAGGPSAWYGHGVSNQATEVQGYEVGLIVCGNIFHLGEDWADGREKFDANSMFCNRGAVFALSAAVFMILFLLWPILAAGPVQ